MACNACFPAPSGTPMAYVMICVPMCLSNWACSRPSWSSTKAAFPSEAKNRPVLVCSIAEPLVRRENCQVGVFLSYVTANGHTLIDRELYLPLDWCADRDRCRAAGIPDDKSRFQTKPELAQKMIERIFQTQIPICWVVADTVYGGNLDLRTWLETHGYPYVMAVACNEPVGFQTPTGRRREEAGMPRSGRPSRWGFAAPLHDLSDQRPQARPLGH